MIGWFLLFNRFLVEIVVLGIVLHFVQCNSIDVMSWVGTVAFWYFYEDAGIFSGYEVAVLQDIVVTVLLFNVVFFKIKRFGAEFWKAYSSIVTRGIVSVMFLAWLVTLSLWYYMVCIHMNTFAMCNAVLNNEFTDSGFFVYILDVYVCYGIFFVWLQGVLMVMYFFLRRPTWYLLYRLVLYVLCLYMWVCSRDVTYLGWFILIWCMEIYLLFVAVSLGVLYRRLAEDQ
jgi:hypothetical protein